MFSLTRFAHRNKVDTAYRVNVSAVIDAFHREVREKCGSKPDWLNPYYIKEMINSNSLHAESLMPPDNESILQVDYTKSNLGAGKGAVFFFLCPFCHERVKYLYQVEPYSDLRCRVCQRLTYPRKRKGSAKHLEKLIELTNASNLVF